ncbi:aquaporin [Prosthecochloris sp. SCSIO W1101]|uniref:MIP/aquaporin family protein n=1 Tax=Prosthecochloris sp. SCSIO W1101 TaxID=2992242 RepID=UPI00223D358E|nr:aquaporin [Prosthecochloris sp. SCSIO W1101]UZJ42277.1 aquaporin [Prosthecochloris sp. SCSIO W1101]
MFSSRKNTCIAETIGTFALVFAGCGAIIVNDLFGAQLGHTGISMVFGLTVMAMIYSIGNISGAHINPAVTLGIFFAGRIQKQEILPYITCQFIGALLAAGLLKLLFSSHESLGATLPSRGLINAFVLEVVLSFFLMFVILNVSTGHMEKGIMAGVAIGGTVAFEAPLGGPVSGASMNPARSLGPALVSGNLSTLWIYLTAPIIGTWLARPTCRMIQGNECCHAQNETTGKE